MNLFESRKFEISFFVLVFLFVICDSLISAYGFKKRYNAFENDNPKADTVINENKSCIMTAEEESQKRDSFFYAMSEEGIEMIKHFEKLSLDKYKIEGEKYFTIGYGHQIRENEDIGEHISEKHADKLLESDIKKVNKSINSLVSELDDRLVFSQGFIDGLGSLIYNCGENGVRESKFFKRLKRCRFTSYETFKKDYDYALAGVKDSNIVFEGHKARRKAEYKIMIKD